MGWPRVAGAESAEAIRQLPQNDSEQADVEREAKDRRPLKRDDGDDDQPHVDVIA